VRHSYATWMLEAGADLRWVKDQFGHASIDETEGTYGHLEREQHERRVDLDAVLGTGSGASTGVHASDAGAAIEGQRRDFPREDFLVEGKGFVTPEPPSSSDLATPSLPQAAPSGIPRPPASTVHDPTSSPDRPPSAPAPRPAESHEKRQEEGPPALRSNR
jgi:integrase-like protein